MNRRYFFLTAACAALLTASAFPLQAADAPAAPAELAKIRELNVSLLDKLSSSVVWIDYYFRLDDKGRQPEFTVTYMCPNCNSPHTGSARAYIDEERPFRVSGFAVAPDEFIAADIMLLPEWLDRIEVSSGEGKLPAKIVAYYPEQKSVRLKTAQPLPGVKPLQFQPAGDGKKLYSFFLVDEASIPVAGVAPYAPAQVSRIVETGLDTVTTLPNSMVVDAEGNVVNLSMLEEMPLDLLLKNPVPADWRQLGAAEQEAQLTAFGKTVADNVFNVRIQLAPSDSEQPQNRYGMGMEDGDDVNEITIPGILLDSGKLLIPAALPPEMTARLDSITLTVDGKAVEAAFAGSLKNYGAMLAQPAEKLPGSGFKLSTERMVRYYRVPLFGARLHSYGNQLDISVFPEWIETFATGPKGILVPQTSNSSNALFAEDGTLLGLPLQSRIPGSRQSNGMTMIPADTLAALLADPANNFDAANIPRAKEERNRMAWLGVEVQPLDQELARANDAAQLTDDGSTGLLITQVYPDSPASAMGLKVGEILLQLIPADSKRTIELEGSDYDGNIFHGSFPWDQYDGLPEMYYDQIPQPWGSARNALNRLLTSIGIGNKATLTVIDQGKLVRHELTIAQAPPTFDNAPRYADRDMGLTLADTTFEVRNYFRMKPEDAGIVVAKVRAGGKASVAGIKPYEIVVSVNDTPVHNIEEFQKLIAGQSELRLGIRRLAATRIVTIKLTQPEK